MSAVGIALRFQMVDRAKAYLRMWLANHPNDESMRGALEELEAETVPKPQADSVGAE
jgi:hypothetical protein